MRYFLDCEFNGFGGELISIALVAETGASIYCVLVREPDAPTEAWVAANVIPILDDCPVAPLMVRRSHASAMIADFLAWDIDPIIVADWPDDIRYLCELLITGVGRCVQMDGLKFEWRHVEPYPTEVVGAVQHNAWWDAQALRHKLSPVPQLQG